MELLSDAAFKLYIYVCLHAERNTGCLDLVETNMARALGKSPQLIQDDIEEMERQGICRRWHGAKDQGYDQIEVCDDFWPYEKDSLRARSDHETQYLERIRQLLTGHFPALFKLPRPRLFRVSRFAFLSMPAIEIQGHGQILTPLPAIARKNLDLLASY